MNEKFDSLDARVERLEKRMDAVETRLDDQESSGNKADELAQAILADALRDVYGNGVHPDTSDRPPEHRTISPTHKHESR